MNQKQIVADLLAKADKYRGFATWMTDGQTVRAILAVALELKQRARTLAKPDQNQIRQRAREIWEDNGRPPGRDLEFWLQAEREFREAEALAKESRHEQI